MPYSKTQWNEPGPPFLDAANMNKIEAGIEDAHETADGAKARLDSQTVDQTLASPQNTGSITQLLSWLAGAVKSITGELDWKNAPATTLKGAKTHMDRAGENAHAETPASIGAAPASHVGAGGSTHHAVATQSSTGFVELATTGEVQSGASGVLVPTAAELKAELDRRVDPKSEIGLFHGNGPTIFGNASMAASTSLTSADLRGTGSIPLDAKGVYVSVFAGSQATNSILYIHSADAPNNTYPSVVFVNAVFAWGQFIVPLGVTNAGKIKINNNNNALSAVNVYANGRWR